MEIQSTPHDQVTMFEVCIVWCICWVQSAEVNKCNLCLQQFIKVEEVLSLQCKKKQHNNFWIILANPLVGTKRVSIK